MLDDIVGSSALSSVLVPSSVPSALPAVTFSSLPALESLHAALAKSKEAAAASPAADGVSPAALDIQKAIESALSAVKLSETGLDAKTVASLESCLSTVLSSGGLPAGYACLTKVSFLQCCASH